MVKSELVKWEDLNQTGVDQMGSIKLVKNCERAKPCATHTLLEPEEGNEVLGGSTKYIGGNSPKSGLILITSW